MPSRYSSFIVDWYDQSDAYATSIAITNHVKTASFTDTGTGEVNEARIVLRSNLGRFLAADDWVTSTAYFLGDRVKESSKFYRCITAHTSGLFSTDLAAGRWTQEPDLDVQDRFRIRCTDLDSNTYDRYFEVDNYIPSMSKGEGGLVTITMKGIEFHTEQIHMTRPYYFEDAFTVASDIGSFYNINKGSEQPLLSNHSTVFDGTKGNGLPVFTANNYEYGIVEDRCYNRWMDVTEKMLSSVSAGGILTPFELSFETTGVNAIDLKIRKSGDNSTIKTIKNAKVTNPKAVGEQEGEVLNPTGTNVMAWGAPEYGSLPVGFSKYDSHLQFFIFRPDWGANIDYVEDAKVKVVTSGIAKHYVATSLHTGNTSGAVDFATDLAAGWWTQIDMSDEFGDSESYSPWTDSKATVWGNMGCDPKRTTYTAGGWFDINVVVNDDDEWFRTWVDAKAINDAELQTLADDDQAAGSGVGYSYETINADQIDRFPNGFRVLVNGTGAGELTGFDNQVVEWKRTAFTQYNWVTLYDFGTAADADPKVHIAVIHEGKVYEGAAFNGTPTWTAVDTTDWANDCFHPYSALPTNVAGIDYVTINNVKHIRAEVTDSTNRPDITKDTAKFAKNNTSAIKFVTNSLGVANLPVSWTSQDDYYEASIGFNFRFPLPNNNYNGISEKVGELYGGGGATNWTGLTVYSVGDKVIESGTWYMCVVPHTADAADINVDINAGRWILYFPEPSVLDIQNMNYCSDGQVGFNRGGSSEDLGSISAVAFWLRISRIAGGLGNIEWNGEHPFRCWFIDTKDNVVYQDFVVRFSNNWQDCILPISGFRPYKGRAPVYKYAIDKAMVVPKELEILNIFEWRNVKLGGVQYQGKYDDHGRFFPLDNVLDTATPNVLWGNLFAEQMTLEMDGFRFVKPLLTGSGQESTRNLEPDFLQRPNITLYHQLQSDAKSQLEIEKFRHKEFNTEDSGTGMFDVRFGDSYYFTNSKLVSDSDNGANTIKLVAKRIEYTITKPRAGRGGIKRRIKGSKVFT
jgi:hypothetical protein